MRKDYDSSQITAFTPTNSGGPNGELQSDTAGESECGEKLMEDGWEEGFTCGVKRQHTIHVDFSDGNTSIDNKNRSYQWAYLWRYDD